MKFLFFILFVSSALLVFSQEKYKLYIILNDDSKNSEKILLRDSVEAEKAIKNFITEKINNGFLEIIVDSTVFSKNTTQVYIGKGNRYKWGKIDFSLLNDYEIKKIGIRKKYYSNYNFSYNRFLKLKRKTVKYYENNGYPFAEVHLDSLRYTNNTFFGKFIINKNNYIVFDSLINKGNAKISNKFLEGYLSIKKNKAYSEKQISQIDNKLKKLPYLNIKEGFKQHFTDKVSTTYIFADNKKANQFNGILGILPNNQTNGKLLLTGEISLLMANAFTYGEKIAFEWKKLSEKSQDLKAKAEIKHIYGSPIGFDEKFNIQKIDTSYLLLNNKSGLQFIFKNNTFIKLFYETKSSSLLSTNNPLISINDINNYNSKMGGTGFYIENFDYIFNPQKGYFIDLNISIGKNQKTFNNSTQNLTKFEGEVEIQYFIKMTDLTSIKLRNISGFMNNMISSNFTNVFYNNEMFRLGGLNTIRGFDQESILCSNYSIANIEYRLIFDKNSALYAFYDIGYYEKNNPTEFINDKPMGFGFGIDFETRAGIFTVNYALGKQFNNPVEFRSAKIHFGLINRF